MIYKTVSKMMAGYMVVCIIFIILFKTVFMLSLVPTESMNGTIIPGDILISSRYDVGKDELERYDILVFVLQRQDLFCCHSQMRVHYESRK